MIQFKVRRSNYKLAITVRRAHLKWFDELSR